MEIRIEEIKPLCKGRRYTFAAVFLSTPHGRIQKDLLIHPGAVVILPFLDNDRIIMLRQYRPGPAKWIYELPAGTIEEGEEPEEAARRELEEETGYVAGKMKLLFKMYPSPGVSTEVMHMFCASRLAKGRLHRGEDEFMETFVLDFKDAIGMIEKGYIEDGKTIALLLYCYSFPSRCRC